MIERREHLFHRRFGVEAVNLVEVDRVDTEPAEAVLARLLNVLTGEATHIGTVAHREEDLRGDDDLVEVSILAEPTSCDLFARSE